MVVDESLIEAFLNSLEQKKYHKEIFYDMFFDFLDKNGYSVSSDEEELALEAPAFKKALERGLIGYDVLLSISDTDLISKKIRDYISKKQYYLFHFMREKDDEKLLSYTEIWNKWKNLPPLGWIGGWCNCGSFFPYTLDMGGMNIKENSFTQNEQYKPIEFYLKDVKEMQFCSDNHIRFILKSGETIAATPYKIDNSLIYNFIDNPLDILK